MTTAEPSTGADEAQAPEAAPASGRTAATRIVLSVLAACVLVLCIAGGVGWSAGWRVHVMTTPSMGQADPVGTLVISRPVRAADVRVGDVIVFHPPGRDAVYTHRVHDVVFVAGVRSIGTKGDINAAADPWMLGQSNLLGRQVATVPDGGFVLQCLPWLLVGAFVILLATAGMRRNRRSAARILLGSILVSILIVVFRPLERIVLLEQVISGGHGVATVVPTGALPLRAWAEHGSQVALVPGQVGAVHLDRIGAYGAFRITSTLHLSGWWWLALLGWALPIVVALAIRRE